MLVGFCGPGGGSIIVRGMSLNAKIPMLRNKFCHSAWCLACCRVVDLRDCLICALVGTKVGAGLKLQAAAALLYGLGSEFAMKSISDRLQSAMSHFVYTTILPLNSM